MSWIEVKFLVLYRFVFESAPIFASASCCVSKKKIIVVVPSLQVHITVELYNYILSYSNKYFIKFNTYSNPSYKWKCLNKEWHFFAGKILSSSVWEVFVCIIFHSSCASFLGIDVRMDFVWFSLNCSMYLSSVFHICSITFLRPFLRDFLWDCSHLFDVLPLRRTIAGTYSTEGFVWFPYMHLFRKLPFSLNTSFETY